MTINIDGTFANDSDLACTMREIARLIEEGYYCGLTGDADWSIEGDYESEEEYN